MSGKSGSGSQSTIHHAPNSAQVQKKGVLNSLKQFFGFGQKPTPQIVHVSDKDLKNVPSAIRVLTALPYVENGDLSADPLLVGPIDPRVAVVSEDIPTNIRQVRTLGVEAHVITNLPPWHGSGDAVPEKSTESPTKTTIRPEMDPADITTPKDAEVGLLPTIVAPGETAAATIPEPPKEAPQIEEKAAVKVEVTQVKSTPSEVVKTEASPKADTVNFTTQFPQTVITKDAQMPLRAIKAGPGFTVGYIARLRISSTGYPSGVENSLLQAGHMVIFAGNIAAAQSPDRLYYRTVKSAFDATDFSNIGARYAQFPSGLMANVENEAETIRPPDARELAFNTKTGVQPVLSFTGLKSIVLPADRRKDANTECVQVVEFLIPKECETLLCHFLYSQTNDKGLPVAGNVDPDSVLSRITDDIVAKKKPTVFLPAEFESARNQSSEDRSLGSHISANASSFEGLRFYDDAKPKKMVDTIRSDLIRRPDTGKVSDQASFGIVALLCSLLIAGVMYLARSNPDCVTQPISPRLRLTRRPAWQKVTAFPSRTTVGGNTEPVTELRPSVLRPVRPTMVHSSKTISDSEILDEPENDDGEEVVKPRFAKRPPRSRSTSPIRQRGELQFGKAELLG